MVNRKSTRDLRYCATTNRAAFEKHTYFQRASVCSKAIHRLSV